MGGYHNDVTTTAAGDPSSGTAHPSSISAASDLTGDSADTATYAAASWNSAGSGTAGARNFGTDMQNPALVYADYDGMGTGTDYCASFPATVPGSDPPVTLTCGSALVGGAANQDR